MRLYPLAGQPLGFGYLFASHPPFDEVFVLLCTHISLGCRKIGPHIVKHIIFWYAVAPEVHKPEVELGFRIPFLSASTPTLRINRDGDDC
jgi:hypothetical protein